MMLARSYQLLAAGVAVCLGGTLFVGVGGASSLARAGEASLEFVGNLIESVHDLPLSERLDPTYPHCF
ncbi:hypothetical protein [Acidipila sp. EB88]|uniref:hypothetical protein n=1 Tax=Acidipila sp. EB88 TaxID=2305226 RepID=UPI000F5F0D33|nr:hypothetical protein [Acidipila sp. EB88]RRA47513.1 hypothetical protein D1Y84_03580 [Acidipila sp. EB88]